MKLKSKEIFFGSILLVSFLLLVLVFYGYQIVQTPNLQVEKENKYLYIPKGADFQKVLRILQQDTILQDAISFAFLSKLLKYQENIKPGKYLIKKDMSNLEAVRMLRAGAQVPVKVTFNNIRLREDFSEKIAKYLSFEKKELDQLLNSPEVTQQYGFNTRNILSMFLPNTYEMYWTTSPRQFLDRMHQEYNRFWTEEKKAKAKNLGLTPKEVGVLASIVQAETQKNDEKPRIAGVYINRLRKGIKLEADPTLVFASGDFSLKRVLNKHKEIDSPYNTYKYKGLPPGPINMPSPQSIKAVLNYEQHKFLFFCSKEDFSGYHNFAQTYSEHLRNARLYHKALNLKGIK